MTIDTQLVAQLRKETGAGIVDCKKALVESQGDLDQAKEWLRKHGMAKAGKKQDRQTGEGIVISYIHGNKKVGVLLTLLCETDFVARNEAFQELGNEITMHIAAMNPMYLDESQISEEEKSKQRDLFKEELTEQGKAQEMLEKIVEGKMAKYYKEVCVLNQPFIKDEDITIGELIAQKTAVLGEKIEIGRFVRYEITGSL